MPKVKFLSISTDPKWYPARQSLRLDPSASAFVLFFYQKFFSWLTGVEVECYGMLSGLISAVMFFRGQVSQGWGNSADTSCGNHSQLLLQWPRTSAHMGNRESTRAQTHTTRTTQRCCMSCMFYITVSYFLKYTLQHVFRLISTFLW